MSDPKGVTNRDLAEALVRARMAEAEEAGLSANYPADQDVPAIFVNKFTVRAQPHVVRIAFGEAVTNQGFSYRDAVMMSREDAKELAALILKLTGA